MFRADGYSELFHGFQLALEVSGLRPSTIKHYTTDGRKFLEYYPDVSPSEITSIHIRQYLALLKQRVSAKTVYEVQLALRKFFRFLVDEGEIAGSPCDGIKLTRYAEFVISGINAKANYAILEANREEIEKELQRDCVWHSTSEARMCRIYVRRFIELHDRTRWPEYIEWLVTELNAFYSYFNPVVRSLSS